MMTLTLSVATEIVTAHYLEMRGKAMRHFRNAGYGPELRDDAFSRALADMWRKVRQHIDEEKLIPDGGAVNRIMALFMWGVRQTVRGRIHRDGNCSRDALTIADPSRPTARPVGAVHGLELDGFTDDRDAVPDIVAFRLDTPAWLAHLSDEQRARALAFMSGADNAQLAREWNVSKPAVSMTRRRLYEDHARFVGESL